MHVDGEIHLFGSGQHRFESLGVEELTAHCSHGESADEAQFVDTAFHLVGGRDRIVQRDRRKAPESSGMFADLPRECIVDLAAQLHRLRVVKSAGTVCAV